MELTLKLGSVKCYYSVDRINLALNENLKIEITNKTATDYSLQFNDKIFKFVSGVVEIPYEFISERNKLTVITPAKKMVCPQLFVDYLNDGNGTIQTAEQHFEDLYNEIKTILNNLIPLVKNNSDDMKRIKGEITEIKKQLQGTDYFN